ncbi:MAG: NRDE family protein [Flavobacteriales bacterium]|nr:NRDE family protein [Flavobacteriales bacterium]
MCLCLFAIEQHDEFPFILLANRDEFRKRPSAKADFWKDEPQVLAGRDLQQMGTWLGINKTGSLAFLTNYRDMNSLKPDAPSRGHLVSDFLIDGAQPKAYLKSIKKPDTYNGFNLVVGTPKQLFYYSNVKGRITPITAGIHGLSNALLNSEWPKSEEGKAALSNAISENRLDSDNLFSILENTSRPADKKLPKTGVSIDLERVLSSRFINTPDYGTVCSTVIKIDRNNNYFFEERTFDKMGNVAGKVSFEMSV